MTAPAISIFSNHHTRNYAIREGLLREGYIARKYPYHSYFFSLFETESFPVTPHHILSEEMADDRTIASIFPTHHTRDYVIKRNSQGERESPPYHSLSYLSKKK
jgi:hypothetical protein